MTLDRDMCWFSVYVAYMQTRLGSAFQVSYGKVKINYFYENDNQVKLNISGLDGRFTLNIIVHR